MGSGRMAETSREELRALWRRAEEVRALAQAPGAARPEALAALDAPDELVPLLARLVDDLESSHRRLIQGQVHLVSLREVARSLAGPRGAAAATLLGPRPH